MTLVEMIEALQSECLKDPDEFVPGTDVAFLEDVAKRLTSILAAAHEQGSALCRQAADITNLRMELAAMKEQPSTDLREIAEALSNLRNELRGLFVRDDLTAGEMVLRTEISNTNVECIRRRLDAADSILAAFREQKAEVGK